MSKANKKFNIFMIVCLIIIFSFVIDGNKKQIVTYEFQAKNEVSWQNNSWRNLQKIDPDNTHEVKLAKGADLNGYEVYKIDDDSADKRFWLIAYPKEYGFSGRFIFLTDSNVQGVKICKKKIPLANLLKLNPTEMKKLYLNSIPFHYKELE